MGVATILERILERKREEVAVRSAQRSAEQLRAICAGLAPARGFADALATCIVRGESAVIAEIKKASPSRGLIRADFDPVALARSYQRGGAACLSVLTDVDFFQGADAYLCAARAAVDLPVLRKDFVVDAWQVLEARTLEADCILLIAAAFAGQPARMGELAALAAELVATSSRSASKFDKVAICASREGASALWGSADSEDAGGLVSVSMLPSIARVGALPGRGATPRCAGGLGALHQRQEFGRHIARVQAHGGEVGANAPPDDLLADRHRGRGRNVECRGDELERARAGTAPVGERQPPREFGAPAADVCEVGGPAGGVWERSARSFSRALAMMRSSSVEVARLKGDAGAGSRVGIPSNVAAGGLARARGGVRRRGVVHVDERHARALGRDVGEIPPEWHHTAEVLKSRPGAAVTEDIPETTTGVFPIFFARSKIVAVTSGAVFSPKITSCLLYTSPSPRDRTRSRMPSSA